MSLKKIVIASDSFKGTMDSIKVSNIIEKGILKVYPNVETFKIPIADGGEGTVDAFLSALGGEKVSINVKGPLFKDITAFYGILEDGETAVIEMAAASGLPLVGENRNACKTTTYGTGQLIVDALNRGCRKIVVGIGGSATNDGGIGMAAALGVRFLNENGEDISLNGEGLGKLYRVDTSRKDKRLNECEILVACDVDNPLYGPSGAAYVFAPQKGADENMVKLLDNNLETYAEVVKRDLDIDIQNIPGAGAAGGLGAGLVAFAGAELKSGINIVLDMVKFEDIIKDADLIITGEGKIDGQSLRGKVPVGIASRARKYDVPVIAIVGGIGDQIEKVYEAGIGAVFSINRLPLDLSVSRNYSEEFLLHTTEDIMRFSKLVF